MAYLEICDEEFESAAGVTVPPFSEVHLRKATQSGPFSRYQDRAEKGRVGAGAEEPAIGPVGQSFDGRLSQYESAWQCTSLGGERVDAEVLAGAGRRTG